MCKVCKHIYDEEKEGITFRTLDEEWKCPICESPKTVFDKTKKEVSEQKVRKKYSYETEEEYEKFYDLSKMSYTGKSVLSSMGSKKEIEFSLDDINFIPAQVNKFPLNKEEDVEIGLVIGPKSKKPFKVNSPILISALSYGAVSTRVREVVSTVARENNIGFNTGEGGILDSDIKNNSPVIVQYATGRFGITEEILKKAKAIEIKIGQGAYPGKGSFLPASKIDKNLAKIRGLSEGEDAYSPARHPDINSHDQLREKVNWLKKVTDGVPVGAKLGCGNIEKDIEVLLNSKVDYIALDGFAGGTGATDKYIKDHMGIPIFAAIPRAVKHLEELGERENITLIGSGGIKSSNDIAKLLALGANGTYIGTTALIGLGCKQYRVCHKGDCGNGITTNDPELVKNLHIDKSVISLNNLITVLNNEIKGISRVLGEDKIKNLDKSDLISLKKDLAEICNINWLGSY